MTGPGLEPPTPATCSAASLAVGEPLAATATEAASWLLVEVRGAWGRDAVADSGLAEPVRGALEAFPGKVLLIRRPDRREGVTVIRATADERGGTATRRELGSLAELPSVDVEQGDPIAGPIFLVCAHGRRDACCARLGLPLFDALQASLPPERLWQSSHLGGHRFAPNVLVLPAGVQLGRIPVERAAEVVALLDAGTDPARSLPRPDDLRRTGAGGRDRRPLRHRLGRDRRPAARRARR